MPLIKADQNTMIGYQVGYPIFQGTRLSLQTYKV